MHLVFSLLFILLMKIVLIVDNVWTINFWWSLVVRLFVVCVSSFVYEFVRSVLSH